LPGVGRRQADDHVEGRRLAGAVGAEQADDFSPVATSIETPSTTARPR
jgi:hypothetical protein